MTVSDEAVEGRIREALLGSDPEEPDFLRPIAWLGTLLDWCAEPEVLAVIRASEDPDALHTMISEVNGLRDRVLAALSASQPHMAGWRAIETAKRWRHKKRGSVVREIGQGRLQNARDVPLADMTPVQIYIHEEDCTLWVRAIDEFEDGRFEPLPVPPPPQEPEQGR